MANIPAKKRVASLLPHSQNKQTPVAAPAEDKKLKIAFVNQPWDYVVPPVQDGALPTASLPIWVYYVAHHLSRSNEVVIYGRGSPSRTGTQYHDGVHYQHIQVGLDQWFFLKLLRLFGLLKRCSGLKNVKRPYYASSLYYLGYILQVAIDLRKQQCDVVQLFNYSQFVPVIRALNLSLPT